MYKQKNKALIKENEKLNKKINSLETKNIFIFKQAYRWLNEKNTWKYKYQRQKVMATIYKEGTCEGIDCLLHETHQEASRSR